MVHLNGSHTVLPGCMQCTEIFLHDPRLISYHGMHLATSCKSLISATHDTSLRVVICQSSLPYKQQQDQLSLVVHPSELLTLLRHMVKTMKLHFASCKCWGCNDNPWRKEAFQTRLQNDRDCSYGRIFFILIFLHQQFSRNEELIGASCKVSGIFTDLCVVQGWKRVAVM